MGQKGEESTAELLEEPNSSKPDSPVKEEQAENDSSTNNASEQIRSGEEASEEVQRPEVDARSMEEMPDGSGEPEDRATADHSEAEVVSPSTHVEVSEQRPMQVEQTDSGNNPHEEERSEEAPPELSQSEKSESTSHMDQVEIITSTPTKDYVTATPDSMDELKEEKEVKKVFPVQAPDVLSNDPDESRTSSAPDTPQKIGEAEDNSKDNFPALQHTNVEATEAASNTVTHQDDAAVVPIELKQLSRDNSDAKEQHLRRMRSLPDITDSVVELEKVKKEMKMMETALQGAARQAQVLTFNHLFLIGSFFLHANANFCYK